MAVDTITKRRMAGGAGFHPVGPGVTPDSDQDEVWRVSSAWGYYQEPQPVDTEDCFSRRPELEHMCLRRSDEDLLALRRAPECPTEFACPAAGCV